MTYVEHLNALIRNKVACTDRLVMLGQNIGAGSCLSGLTHGLVSEGGLRVINTPNSENTIAGTGFGLALSGVDAIYFMKQQDFLLLAVDQLVNTYSLIRRRPGLASFTIIPIVVDSGFEGPQAALNNLADFCSVARVPGFTITNAHDSECVIERHLIAPGFRIIAVSQRLFRTELIAWDGGVTCHADDAVCQYADGADATIAAFNFSFPQAADLWRDLGAHSVDAALFSVSAAQPVDWRSILDSVARTGRLIVIDDAKSINRPCQHLVTAAHERDPASEVLVRTRNIDDSNLSPNADRFVLDHADIRARLGFGDNAVAAATRSR